MGKALLVYRLTVRDLRHHAAQAVLLVIAIAAATATLTMALSMNGVTSQPYSADAGPEGRARRRGVPDIHRSGEDAGTRVRRREFQRTLSGRRPPPSGSTAAPRGSSLRVAAGEKAAVDRPDVTAGSWVRPGGVVLERTFAEGLGARVGDVVTLNGQRFTVAGIAVTAAQPPYPNLCYFTASSCPPWLTVPGGDWRNVGLIWMTRGWRARAHVEGRPAGHLRT